jgi:hypothetical protein
MKRELFARASKVSRIICSWACRAFAAFDNQSFNIASVGIAAELFEFEKGKVTPLSFAVQWDHKGLDHQACGAVIERLIHLAKDTTSPQTILVHI